MRAIVLRHPRAWRVYLVRADHPEVLRTKRHRLREQVRNHLQVLPRSDLMVVGEYATWPDAMLAANRATLTMTTTLHLMKASS